MNYFAFSRLAPESRVQLVLAQGTHLAWRSQQANSFQLYHLANTGRGIFVELSYEPALKAIIIVRSSTRPDLLEDYLERIKLPPYWREKR